MSKFCGQSQKNKFDKTWTEIDRSVEFFCQPYVPDYGKSGEIIFHNLVKKMWLMLDKFILMQCRNYKTIWLIMTNKDTISMSDGHSFPIDHLLSIIKTLLTTYVNGKYLRLRNQTRPMKKVFSWLMDGINRNILRIPSWS